MTDVVQLEQSELKIEELREQQLVLRTLMTHSGWRLLTRYAHYQQAEYQRTALKPLQSMEGVPFGEFTKGVAQGITEVLSLPAQLLSGIETELEVRAARQLQTEGAEDGAGTDDDDEA